MRESYPDDVRTGMVVVLLASIGCGPTRLREGTRDPWSADRRASWAAARHGTRACEDGVARACSAAADVYDSGFAWRMYPAKAEIMRRRGCALGDPGACSRLAANWVLDEWQRLAFAKRACALGDRAACAKAFGSASDERDSDAPRSPTVSLEVRRCHADSVVPTITVPVRSEVSELTAVLDHGRLTSHVSAFSTGSSMCLTGGVSAIPDAVRWSF